jgi:hypothetical protein
MWLSVQSMDPVVLHEIQRENISTEQMLALAGVYQEFGLPTLSELILGLPGDSYERHVKSLSEVVEAGIDIIDTYSCMLLNGTKLNSQFSRANYGIGSHFRILPRDFARLRNGRIAVEIEEIISSTRTMSFKDYQQARKLHLMVAVVYNGAGFGPLLRFLRHKKVPVIKFLEHLVLEIETAPESVQKIFQSFVRLTKEELWDSEEALRAYIYEGDNYEKLLKGEIGINLIQTHTAMSLAAMDDWAGYIFRVADGVLAGRMGDEPEDAAFLAEVKAYCAGRTHNIWGSTADEDIPGAIFQYDVEGWARAELFALLSDFRLAEPVYRQFGFTMERQMERAALIQRYGTTPTGIGRIIIQMGRNRIWRETLLSPVVAAGGATVPAARRWPT